MRIVYTISPCSCMFMYPCFLSISPYCYVYVSKVLTLFHHTIVYYVSKLFILFLMCQDFLLYFTILICYVSKLFILFLMCQNFLLYFIISIMYVYVSAFVYYFTVHINRARYVSILICYFTIHCCMYVYVSMFSLYFTILLCLCVQGTYTISPYYLYIMCPSFLSCFLCVRTFYSVSLYVMCLCIHVFVLFHHIY